MKNKGFTLIELLAVIIILAIIALIAVPTILNIIENSKKKALENTAYGMIRAGEYYYLEHSKDITEDKEFSSINNYEGLEFKGKKVEGSLTITPDGKISINICNDGYCATKGEDKSLVTVSKKDENEEDSSICTSVSGTVSYGIGVAYSCNLGDGIERTFYVLETSGDNVSLIMNQNLGDPVKWITEEDYTNSNVDGTSCSRLPCNDEGPVTALRYLKEQTESWMLEAQLPTRAQIYYASGSTDLTRYPWLYENTGYNNYGNAGYWTITPSGDSRSADAVVDSGVLSSFYVNSGYVGIRPVITISKSSLSS